jgi:hypothetical protein
MGVPVMLEDDERWCGAGESPSRPAEVTGFALAHAPRRARWSMAPSAARRPGWEMTVVRASWILRLVLRPVTPKGREESSSWSLHANC